MIATALASPRAIWLPELTPCLVADQWVLLNNTRSIAPPTYSTTGMVAGGQSPTATLPLTIERGTEKPADIYVVEFLPDTVQNGLHPERYHFFSPVESEVAIALECLRGAFRQIMQAPSLYETVRQLIKSIHILKCDEDDYDVSYSLPELSFSVFVSVPSGSSALAQLRLAEALIHEAMHLQLTIIERLVPLVPTNAGSFYSPWKQAQRSASGLLHGLYVFSAIDAWLSELPAPGKVFSERRRTEIRAQVEEIAIFIDSDLTENGNTLRSHLMAHLSRCP